MGSEPVVTYEIDMDPELGTPRLRGVFNERMLVMGYEAILLPYRQRSGRYYLKRLYRVLRNVRTKRGLEERWCRAGSNQVGGAAATYAVLTSIFLDHIRRNGWQEIDSFFRQTGAGSITQARKEETSGATEGSNRLSALS